MGRGGKTYPRCEHGQAPWTCNICNPNKRDQCPHGKNPQNCPDCNVR